MWEYEKNPIEKSMDDVLELIHSWNCFDVESLEQKIQTMKSEYKDMMIWILRSGWFDEDIMDNQKRIIINN